MEQLPESNLEQLSSQPNKLPTNIRINDIILISIMATLAGCGLIYEYLLSHYSGRVLGSMESAIYSIIGIMIVSMGLGSFYARRFKHCFTAFAWLEVSIALLGSSVILILAALIGYSHLLPQIVAAEYGIDTNLMFSEGFTAFLIKVGKFLPYVFGFILGFLLGMEIPLMARIREHYYRSNLNLASQKHQALAHNAGTIYGADYIGAGIGAAIWVLIMLKLEINQAAALTASLNVFAGTLFIIRFRHYINGVGKLLVAHGALVGVICLVFAYGGQWQSQLQSLLYFEEVVHQQLTPHQNLVFTRHSIADDRNDIIDFYINGSLQFSSMDEHVYHEMLVHPAMMSAARTDKVLIIGGGDGLALREVHKWHADNVTLVDFDAELIELFTSPHAFMAPLLADQLTNITQNSFNQPNVTVINQDAFLYLDELQQAKKRFDVILVDLPDPNHPDLNKLYSVFFYKKLKSILAGDGVMTVQSNSPYHAKSVFLSIGKTIKAAGFAGVEQYQQNIPTFGQWGFSMASPIASSPRQKLNQSNKTLPNVDWVTPSLMDAAFEFPANFYRDLSAININQMNSSHLYHYHQEAWGEQGGFSAKIGE